VAGLTALAMLAAAPLTYAELPPLIPREAFFPKPAGMQALRLSPDGRLLSYIGPDAADTPQLWVRELDGASIRQLTDVPPPGVRSYTWAENSRIVCYEYRDGTKPRLVALELASGSERPLVAIDGATIGSVTTRPSTPDEMLVSLRLPNTQDDDVYRVNVLTGALVLDTKNPGKVPGNQFFADSNLVVRAAQRTAPDGGTEVLVRAGPSAPWRSWLTADSTYLLLVDAFSEDGAALLLRTDLGADKARLIARAIKDGKESVIAASSELEVESILLHPRTGAVQAVSILSDPRRWQPIDRAVAPDLKHLALLYPGHHLAIVSRDRADTRWLVGVADDHCPRRVYLWDRLTRKATLLFEEQPHLAGLPLARVKPILFKARDGLRIHGYLTLPVGVAARRLPLVVWVHGGPYLRDAWGYDNIGQLFANRGYAFLRINFRGSRGFGRQFKLASFKQWGGTMQNDILDGVEWVVRRGIADRTKMAIIGHSYGGYVALAALTLTPDLFACGAASSTTANLLAFVNRFPKTPDNAWVRATIGDPENPREAEFLRSVSPIFLVDRLSKPVLIARGDRDEALPPGDLDAFVTEAGKRGQQAVSVLYEGDGHFFRRENQLDFFARVEALFARHLGGRAEPMAGGKQAGSTALVKVVGM
jgi:dipeptidyl aminopeptidase/acylaminoacyl peptidase